MRWRERWGRLPVWARCALVAYAAGFTDGTGAHVRDLAHGGLSAYRFAPAAVQVFFVGLAGSVMAADMAANWFVDRQSPSLLLRPASGLLPITVFGLFVLISVMPLQRCLSAAASARITP